MTDRYEYQTTELYVTICGTGGCGIVFAIPDAFDDARREDGKTFYCPNGCQRVYRESETDRLRRELEREKRMSENRRSAWLAERDQREAAERSLSATRGHLTRAKKRAAAGVCQCCNRTFRNLARHMSTQHPDYVAAARDDTTGQQQGGQRRWDPIEAAVLAELAAAGGRIAADDGSASTQLIDAVVAAVGCRRHEVSRRLMEFVHDGIVDREMAGGRWVYRIELTDTGRQAADAAAT